MTDTLFGIRDNDTDEWLQVAPDGEPLTEFNPALRGISRMISDLMPDRDSLTVSRDIIAANPRGQRVESFGPLGPDTWRMVGWDEGLMDNLRRSYPERDLAFREIPEGTERPSLGEPRVTPSTMILAGYAAGGFSTRDPDPMYVVESVTPGDASFLVRSKAGSKYVITVRQIRDEE